MPVIYAEAEAPPKQSQTTRTPVIAKLGWGLCVSACAGAAALVALAVAHYGFGMSLSSNAIPRLTPDTAALSIAGAGFLGWCLGVSVSMCAGPRRVQNAVALGSSGFVAGVAGVDCCALMLDATDTAVVAALKFAGAWASAGFLAGVFACPVSRWVAVEREKEAEVSEQEDEPDAPAVRIEWLLREVKRPWRISRPLARVLPVLAVAVGALVWGAVAENAALVAVAALGFAAAHAFHRQEKRLDALERRCGSGRDSRPPV